jgi:phenylalanyl-tRNA synthetase alpha chain
MAETLQQLLLDTLDAQSTIKDTRSLVLPGQSQPATSHDAQITILGALNSLLSRDVRVQSDNLVRKHMTVVPDDYIPNP